MSIIVCMIEAWKLAINVSTMKRCVLYLFCMRPISFVVKNGAYNADYLGSYRKYLREQREREINWSTSLLGCVDARTSCFEGGGPFALSWRVLPLPDTFSGPKFSRRKCTRCAESGMICDVPDRGLEPCQQCFDDGAVCSLPFLYVFGVGSLKYAANSTNGLP